MRPDDYDDIADAAPTDVDYYAAYWFWFRDSVSVSSEVLNL